MSGLPISASDNPRLQRFARLLLAFVLISGGIAYAAKGIQLLFDRDIGGRDSMLRWQEEQYVLRGQNPYDVTYAVLRIGNPPWDQTRDTSVIAEVGVPDSGGYPPWAFASGAAFFWMPKEAVKGSFLAASLCFTAITVWWSYNVLATAGASRSTNSLVAAGAFAIAAYSTTYHVGQYGSVVVGLLALTSWCLTHRWDITAGLLLGIAMLKPTITAPFFLILLFTLNWKAVAACLGYLAVASLAVWWRSATNPVEMLLQMLAAGSDFVDDSQGLVGLLLRSGLSKSLVTPVLAVSVLLPGAVVLWSIRNRSLLDQFAVAAVIGRLWAYHKYYDNMMLVFLLVALARAAFVHRSWSLMLAFLACGATLWAPSSLVKSEFMVFLQIAIWIGATGLLLWQDNEPQTAADTVPAKPSFLLS